MAAFPDGRENFAEFENSNFGLTGALHRTSSMSDDDSLRSPLSDITQIFLFNTNGSGSAMEISFGNAIAMESPSWGGGRRVGQRYYTAKRCPRIARKSNLLLGFR